MASLNRLLVVAAVLGLVLASRGPTWSGGAGMLGAGLALSVLALRVADGREGRRC